jgi:iron(III) transport system ATP-binding protein
MLDEPLSNLDAKLRIEMRTEIRRICKEFGLTAIYVTHDQKEALSIADRLAVLDGGNIAQVGTPEEVYRQPRTALVAGFIGETNLVDGKVVCHSEGNIHVQTPVGELAGRPSDSAWLPEPGEAVAVSIRPECLSIDSRPTTRNAIAGKLTESTYLGEVAHYSMKVEGHAETIHLSELNPRRIIRGAGETLCATAKPEDVVLLPPR